MQPLQHITSFHRYQGNFPAQVTSLHQIALQLQTVAPASKRCECFAEAKKKHDGFTVLHLWQQRRAVPMVWLLDTITWTCMCQKAIFQYSIHSKYLNGKQNKIHGNSMPESQLVSLFPQHSWPSPFVSVALGGRGRLLLRPPQVLRHPCLLDVLSLSSCAPFSCLGGRMQPLPTSFQGVESDTWQSPFNVDSRLMHGATCAADVASLLRLWSSSPFLFPHHWKIMIPVLLCVISNCCSGHLLPFHTDSVAFCFHDLSSSLLLYSVATNCFSLMPTKIIRVNIFNYMCLIDIISTGISSIFHSLLNNTFPSLPILSQWFLPGLCWWRRTAASRFEAGCSALGKPRKIYKTHFGNRHENRDSISFGDPAT